MFFRFPVSDSWAWQDDVDYDLGTDYKGSNHGNSSSSSRSNSSTSSSSSNSNNRSSITEETSQSLTQEHVGDYGQGRYIELEGLDDYIMWRDSVVDPPSHTVIRK